MSKTTQKASLFPIAVLLIGTVLLSGCGGSSDGGSSSTPSYTVSTSAGSGGAISPGSASVQENGTTSFSLTPDTGYTIVAVSGCGGTLSGDVYTTGAVTADCTVTASFSLINYTVSTSAGSGGSFDAASATVAYGNTTAFTVAPDTGYEIANVSGCGGSLSGNTYNTGAVTSDCTVTASFSLINYTVSTSAGSGGSFDAASATVAYGNTTVFTITPDAHYSIVDVSGCGGTLTGTTYTTGAVTANCTVTASFADHVTFTNGQNASVVIGEPDFTTTTGGTAQNLIYNVDGNPDVIDGVLYLPDGNNNNRVLGFNSIPASNGANADFVLGAADFTSAGTLDYPQTIADYNGALYVTLANTNKIAVYNTIPTAATSAPNTGTPQAPDFYLTAGTVGGLNYPETMAVAAGKLVVTDSAHQRVLIWNTIPTSDTAPDLVLGQADFTGTSANAGGSPTAGTLSWPAGVWTDGTRLVIVDHSNSRTLIWNSFPTSNAQPADLVLGQPDFNSAQPNQGLSAPTAGTMNHPFDGVYVSGNQLFVADSYNHRVLIWNSWPTVNGQDADVVLGQADFTSVDTSGATQSLMDMPTGLYLSGTQLIVGDEGYGRYLIFNGSW